MKTLAARNRRSAVLTFAGIGFFHLVGVCVVALLMGAGRTSSDREIPQRPPLHSPAAVLAQPPVAEPAADLVADAQSVAGPDWTARHKDARGPWTIDAQGRITWR
ncbi:hypothetical protein [Hydrogenophaga sp.]|uniref:hypothetical protein n=1 Tax=Hydrogenophaga sp. TaxID=1904254 RepID=UPI0035B4FA7C